MMVATLLCSDESDHHASLSLCLFDGADDRHRRLVLLVCDDALLALAMAVAAFGRRMFGVIVIQMGAYLIFG